MFQSNVWLGQSRALPPCSITSRLFKANPIDPGRRASRMRCRRLAYGHLFKEAAGLPSGI